MSASNELLVRFSGWSSTLEHSMQLYRDACAIHDNGAVMEEEARFQDDGCFVLPRLREATMSLMLD